MPNCASLFYVHLFFSQMQAECEQHQQQTRCVKTNVMGNGYSTTSTIALGLLFNYPNSNGLTISTASTTSTNTNTQTSQIKSTGQTATVNIDEPTQMFKKFCQMQAESEQHQQQARDCISNLLPSILSSMVQVWHRSNKLLNSSSNNGNVACLLIQMHQASTSSPESNNSQQQQQQYSWILGHPLVIIVTIYFKYKFCPIYQ